MMIDIKAIAPECVSLSTADEALLGVLKTYLAQHPEDATEMACAVLRNLLIVKTQNKMLSAEKRVLQDLLKQLSEYHERTVQ